MIEQIIRSLNQIEVKGKNNLDILLGCILALEELDKQIKAQQIPSEEPADNEEEIDGR